MKAFTVFVAIFATAFSAFADTTNVLERFSPHFPTNTPILWQAPTNGWPKSLWIYKRLPPRPFPASVISNAAVLASLPSSGMPKPSTNAFYIWSTPNLCGVSFSMFSIQPASATVSFGATNQNPSTGDVPDDETVTRRASECTVRLGLDQAHLVPGGVYVKSNADSCEGTLTNSICARGIHLARELDGVKFFSFGKDNNEMEGFSIEFGRSGQIRSFSLKWPDLEAEHKSLTASPREIVRCIRQRRVLVLPKDDEPNFFARIKMLADAKTFTITNLSLFYGEGIFGEMPTGDEPPQIIAPFAELDAIADFGNSNTVVQLLSPILSTDISRLPGK